MDLYSISQGYTNTMPNPNYDNKTKKLGASPTIHTNDPKYSPINSAIESITRTPLSQIIDTQGHSVEELVEQGITPSNTSRNLDLELAEAQSNLNKAWHAITQTAVSEIGLGTLRGISDLVDFVIGGAIRTATGEENDYTNPVSAQIQAWQDQFKEYQPIYTTPGANILNGGFADFGWWMSNMPSIASSLTLLIPSTGVAKAVSWAGKATKLNKGIGNTRRFLTAIDKADKAAEAGEDIGRLGRISQWINNENTIRTANDMFSMGLNAFTSRVMENYQEASQVYQDMLPEIYNGNAQAGVKGIKDMSETEYAQFVDRNSDVLQDVDISDRSAVAKKIANEAATRTFQMDMINGFFDMYELYGLRNIKRFMNGPMRASVRRKHLNSIKYAGKTKEEIETILKNRSKFDKATEWLGDQLYGSRVAIGAQLSEGVEEAINYIAQEEGFHYGHVLLGTEDKSNFWDTRLIDYAKNPQLYDSAFWGVLGGVAFQGIGSYLAKVKNAYDIKSNEAKYKPNEKTKEAVKKTPWSEAFEMPEIKARVGNIEARKIADDKLRTQLEQIKNGINPFEKNDDDTNKLLETEEEKAIARDRAYNQRARDLLMDAMFVGNWDITRAYLESDEVRDALVNAGVISQEEAIRRQEEAKQLADKMEELYSRNLRAIGNAMRGIDTKTGANYSDIPTEYFQIIAADNMRYQLDAEQFDKNIAQYQPIIGSEEKRLEEELKSNGIDYKETIRSFILAQQLGQIDAELEAARKTLKEGRTENNIDARTISGQSAIRELELRKRVLTNMLRESAQSAYWNTNSAAKLLVTLRASAATESDGKGGYRMNIESERYRKLDNAIVNAFNAETLDDWETASNVLTTLAPEFRGYSQEEFKEAARLADVFNENVARALGENGAIETLDNLSHNLLMAYATVTHNEIAREIELGHIAKDRESIRTLAHIKHNDMKSMRGAALESALHVLKGIAKNYEEENGDMSDILANGTLVQESRDKLKNILSDDDMKTYDDAMRIIALNRSSVTGRKGNTSAINTLLPEMIKDALYRSSLDEFEEVNEEEAAEETPKMGENSSASQTSTQVTEKPQPTKTSQTASKPATTQANGQILDFNLNKAGKKLSTPAATVSVNSSGAAIKLNQYEGGHKEYTDAFLIPVEGEDNTYDLDFKKELDTNSKDGTEEVFSNPNFFSINTPIINGGQVIRNPRVVVNPDGTIAEFKPGVIDNPNSATGQEEGATSKSSESSTEGGTEAGTTTASPSSTGGSPSTSPASSDDEIDPAKFDEPTANPDEAVAAQEAFEIDNLLDDVRNDMIAYAKERQANNEDYNEDDLYKQLQDKYGTLVPETDLKTTFNSLKSFGRLAATKLKLNIKEYNDIADFINASALTDTKLGADEASKARKELEKAFKNILDNFAKRSVIDTHNGKKVISLENLLRYANEVAGDNTMGELLYDKFVELLSEDEDYQILEAYGSKNKGKRKSSFANKNSIIEKAALSEEERFDVSNSPNGRSIDFLSLLKNATEEEREKIYDIIDELKPDDEIEFSVKDSGRGIEFKKNGVVLGTIPVPKVTAESYIMINRGWIVDIPKSKDGSQSKLEQLFIRIMVNPNNEKEIEPILKAIQKAAYTPKTILDKDSGKRISNPEYEAEYEANCDAIFDAISDAGISIDQYVDFSKEKDNIRPANQLIEIYNGVKQTSDQWLGKAGLSREEYNEAIKNRRIASIHNWFEKRKDSFISALALAGNSKLKVKVDTVNQGGLIITSPDEIEPEPVNAEGVIGSKHKGKLEILVASISEAGKVYSTDGTTKQMSAIHAGSTFVGIPRSNGEMALVHAYPQAIGASHLTDEMKEIQKEILSEFERLLSEWSDNRYMTVDNIANFINSLCSSNGGNNPLLRGLKVTKLTNGYGGIQIEYFKDGRKQYIKLFDSHPDGSKASVIKFHEEKATAFKEATRRKAVLSKFKELMNDVLTYNIEFDYVRGSRNLKGVATRGTKGQFIIQIPNGKKHTFKSFKDFIIDNGLVAVTTRSENGKTNFYRPSYFNDQFDNPRITYKIVDGSTTPVEKERTAPIPATPTKKGDTVKTLIESNGNDTTIGEQIINSILNNTQLNVLKNSRIFKELSLGNIIFVDKIPGAIAAHFAKSRKVNGVDVPAGTIAVTQEWIDMLNSDDVERHEEAVRHLIHESIHRKIDTLSKEEQRKLFDAIRNIFDEFVAANERDGVRAEFSPFEYNTNKKSQDKYYKDGKINDKGLEEFLVESITRPYLINRLNAIATDGKKISNRTIGNTKSKNLFQKILAVIGKLFDLNINKGSLLEKEYKLFEQVGLTSTTQTETIETKKEPKVRIRRPNKTTTEQQSGQLELQFDETSPTEETKQEPVQTSQIATSVENITMDSVMNIEVDEDDIDDSSISDNQVASLGQVRDTIIPENRETFESLVSKGAIQINC